MHVKEVEQAKAKRGYGPPRPDSPSVISELGDGNASHYSNWCDCEGLREETHAREYRSFALDSLVVKRQVIQCRPKDQAVDRSFEITCGCSPVFEDVKSDQRFFGDIFLEDDERD